MAILRSLFTCAILFLVLGVEKSRGLTYVVGDAVGWKIPTVGAAKYYSSWAAKHTFFPGDKLVFNFTDGAHDVVPVDKASFDGCDTTTTTTTTTSNSLSASPATVTLSTTGHHYFICTFGQHCLLGQQLSVNVSRVLITSPPPLSLLTSSPPAPSPLASSSPAQTPSTSSATSASPPAPFVPEAPLSPLSEGAVVVPSPTGSFPGIGMGPAAGSFPFSPQNTATTAAKWSVSLFMINSAVFCVAICIY